MKNQKFKRGNLVKLLTGHHLYNLKDNSVEDLSPQNVGRNAIIDYSYYEKYGGNNDNHQYSIIFQDTGSSMAWKNENEMELIDEGGEHLFEEAKVISDNISKQNTDINYILEHLEEDSTSSETILFLFNLLGWDSSFNTNGEFFILFRDWSVLKGAFIHIKNSNSLEEAKSYFKLDTTLNIEKVYNIFHNLSN